MFQQMLTEAIVVVSIIAAGALGIGHALVNLIEGILNV